MTLPRRPVQPPARASVPRTQPQAQVRARQLGDLVEKTLDPVVRKRGFANARLFSQWEAVVGARLAGMAVPEEVKWRRGREGGGTLILGCRSGDALELQHMHGIIMERINGFLGWPAIAAVRLQTGRRMVAENDAVPAGSGTPRNTRSRSSAPRGDARLEDALIRLGEAVHERTERE